MLERLGNILVTVASTGLPSRYFHENFNLTFSWLLHAPRVELSIFLGGRHAFRPPHT